MSQSDQFIDVIDFHKGSSCINMVCTARGQSCKERDLSLARGLQVLQQRQQKRRRAEALGVARPQLQRPHKLVILSTLEDYRLGQYAFRSSLRFYRKKCEH